MEGRRTLVGGTSGALPWHVQSHLSDFHSSLCNSSATMGWGGGMMRDGEEG